MGFIKTIKSAMKKTFALLECNGTYSIALLRNGTFYLISCDYNQSIKRPEFNEVLYKVLNCSSRKDHLLLTQCYYRRKPKLN